jgi:glycosyltransferase involved in cell wall biosynthesis
MGTTGNLKYLSVAAEALRELAVERDFELRVVVPDAGPLRELDLRGVRVVHEVWQPAREVEQLRGFDIGLMPLFPEQEWDRYKCGLKLIQYLALGIPGVAAPVGVNAEILDENQNGFAAVTTAEWLAGLRALTGDAELRRQMGARGRETVRQKYSIQANYPILRNALLELMGEAGKSL